MAISAGGVGTVASGISEILSASGFRAKAAGAAFEKQNYELAAGLADQNEQYTEMSTAIKQSQEERDLFKSLGQTTADVAGAGFATSGSSLDILRESASQGSQARAVLGYQGLITEAGYKEQAQSYRNMASAAQIEIEAENKAASNATLLGGIKIAAGVASMFDPTGITAGLTAVAGMFSSETEGGSPGGLPEQA